MLNIEGIITIFEIRLTSSQCLFLNVLHRLHSMETLETLQSMNAVNIAIWVKMI